MVHLTTSALPATPITNPTTGLTLQLRDGSTADRAKIRNYFTQLFKADEGGQEFRVNLDHVWRISYTRKSDAVYALRQSFTEGVDYQVVRSIPQNPLGGRPAEQYHLSTSCCEFLVVRSNREIFEEYIQARKAVKVLMAELNRRTTPALPENFASALRMLAEQVEANERQQTQLQQQQLQLVETTQQLETTQKQVQEALPAILFHNQLVEAEGLLSLNEVAKKLGFKVRAFFNQLRDDAILMKHDKSNVAMSRYIDAGWFELKTTTYKDSRGKTHVSSTTMVTGKGLIALQRKYSQ